METINLPGSATSVTGTIIVPEGAGPTLIRNSDTQFSCTLANTNAIDTTVFSNSVVLSPGGTIVVDGVKAVYGIGNFTTGTIALQVVPGGISFFQRLSSLLLTDPNGTDFILLKTGSPPEIQIGTGDPAETAPTIFASVIQGAGASRQLGTEIVANHVSGQPGGAFALIELLSMSVDHTIGPQLALEASDGSNSNSLAISSTITNSIKGIVTNSQATPAALAQGILFDNLSGLLSEVNPSGFAGVLPEFQADTTTFTVTQNVFTTLTALWNVNANDPNVGTTYCLFAWGNGVQGSTAQSLTLEIRAFNISTASATIPSSFAAINAAFTWMTLAFVQVTTLASGTAVIQVNWVIFITPAGGTTTVVSAGSSPNTATTIAVAENIHYFAEWSSMTGAPTITCNGSLFGRMAN